MAAIFEVHQQVARLISGINSEVLRKRVCQVEADAGVRTAVVTAGAGGDPTVR